MTRHNAASILIVILLFAVSLVFADTVYLKNGGSISGIIEKEGDDTVEVNTGFGTVTFKKSQIKNIERSSAEESKKMARQWEDEREELKSKEKEFEEARDNRFKGAYENWAEEAKAKRAEEGHVTKQIDIKREPGGKGIIVEVLLNNSVKVNLVLDTGASIIVLSRKAGEKLGVDLSDTKKDVMEMRLADGSKAMARAVILDSVKIQDVEVKGVMAAILLDEVPTIGVTEGLLGMSFLNKFNLKTDLKNMSMSLEKIE
ncbi:MAG: TIGR02281 family clan AA aspartic protease [Candidatus Omnitrophica bacterium]|nr:TIGR02281 family clan AA aspartic protease [Candidatus Omnitrophota bacterium]